MFPLTSLAQNRMRKLIFKIRIGHFLSPIENRFGPKFDGKLLASKSISSEISKLDWTELKLTPHSGFFSWRLRKTVFCHDFSVKE